MRRPLPFATLLLGAVLLFGGIAVQAFRPREADQPVIVSRLAESGDAGRVRFEVRNRTSKSIRLDSVAVLQRFGTNWGFMRGVVQFGGTNCSAQPFRFEILPPGGGRDWKVKLSYGPQVSESKLLWWRLKHAWETRSLSSGWELGEGWEGERYAYTEVLPP